MITVGSPTYITWKEIKSHGLIRTLCNSIFNKWALVQNNIESSKNGIYLHPIYHTHVSDKKRDVSYNLGMAFAKFYSEKLLNIPSLIHLETLKKVGAVEFVNPLGKTKEPDLAGLSINHQWHIMEAKGMSSNKLTSKIEEAKHQGLQVSKVHGQTPATISACATFFGNDRITSLLQDPEPIGEKEININENLFFEWYYKSFFAFNEYLDRKPIDGEFKGVQYKYFTFDLKSLQIQFGLETEIYEIIRDQKYDLIPEYYSKRRNLDALNSGVNSDEISIGLDGFIVKYEIF